jgi:hypothetical protein
MLAAVLFVASFLTYAVIRMMFSSGWLVKECGKCSCAVLPFVNGVRIRNGDDTAYLCDRCNAEEREAARAELAKKYAAGEAS